MTKTDTPEDDVDWGGRLITRLLKNRFFERRGKVRWVDWEGYRFDVDALVLRQQGQVRLRDDSLTFAFLRIDC